MKRVLATVLCFSLGTTITPAMLKFDYHGPSNEPRIELRTRVIKTEYCDSSRLKLYLELSFKNVGTTTVLLNKYAASLVASVVSKNLEALRAGVYEQRNSPTFQFVGAENLLKDEAGATFVVLEPGEDFTSPLKKFVLLDLDCDGGSKCLRKGKHILQIKVLSLGAREDVVRRVRERWRSRGELYSGAIFSEPMEFEVEPRRTRKIVRCN